MSHNCFAGKHKFPETNFFYVFSFLSSSIMLPKMTLNFPDDESYAKAVQTSEASEASNYQTQVKN